MNFFQAQDTARRTTALLVLLLSLAVICLVVMTQLLIVASLYFSQPREESISLAEYMAGFSWPVLAGIATCIITVISFASLYKMIKLRAGGAAIAEMLDGHKLDRASGNLAERKVLNVVEEMAIASGMPVPDVYVIEDPAINAFAAGHDSKDVVIGITRGCIELLTREELQGVIAHEFSHIFNGDMRLNLKLIGILYGILFIGLMGRSLLQSRFYRSGYRNNNSGGQNDIRGIVMQLLLGLGLIIIGYSGVFFGNLIKAAVSRQREFLADASAVQYTRNPSGISGALKKIGGYTTGSRLRHPNSPQISHLFFGDGVGAKSWLFATHPPLEERIRAIEPRWKGTYPTVSIKAAREANAMLETPIHEAIPFTPLNRSELITAAVTGAALMQAIDDIGAPSPDRLSQAHAMLASLPEHLKHLSFSANGACALVHCLLLDEKPEARQQQMNLLKPLMNTNIYSICENAVSKVDNLPVNLRLPLLDMCLPSLKTLEAKQLSSFMRAVMAQIKADSHISLFEWSLYRLLRHYLENSHHHKIGNAALAALSQACCTTLSALVLATHEDVKQAQIQFQKGWKILAIAEGEMDVMALDNLVNLEKAVHALKQMQPLAKPRFLKACCQAIEKNGSYSAKSVEMLRAVADSIDTPIPPVVTV